MVRVPKLFWKRESVAARASRAVSVTDVGFPGGLAEMVSVTKPPVALEAGLTLPAFAGFSSQVTGMFAENCD